MPNGKSAYFLPFDAWVEEIEPILLSNNISSFGKAATLKKDGTPRAGSIGGDDLLSEWRLVWENGSFQIPRKHEFWDCYYDKLLETIKWVEKLTW